MISYVEIPVESIERAVDFYGKVFGWKTAEQVAGGYACIYPKEVKGGHEIGAFKRLPDPVKYSGMIPFFQVADIDEVLARVVELGCSINQQKCKISDHWGHRAVFSDPFGNKIGIHQPSEATI